MNAYEVVKTILSAKKVAKRFHSNDLADMAAAINQAGMTVISTGDYSCMLKLLVKLNTGEVTLTDKEFEHLQKFELEYKALTAEVYSD